jgi:RNA polymerase sigma-70 factor (ECF subfamily)
MTGADASERWLDEHGDVMYRYALRRLGSADDAEEAVQETLTAALENRASFRGESSERTWLIGVLRFKVVDRLRAVSSRRERPVETQAPDAVSSAAFSSGFRTDAERQWTVKPSEAAERAELRRALDQAIDALPLIQRRALVLREVDGLPTKAVCEILNISPTHLSTLLHRGKLRLRRALDPMVSAAAPASSLHAARDGVPRRVGDA